MVVERVIVGIGEAAPARQDGRQSDTSLAVARGTRRLLAGLGLASLTEVTLASGRRADILAVGADGTVWIVEIKSSVQDFRTDRKWQDYRAFCDRLFFAIPESVPPEIMPEDAGLILADSYGAEMLAEAPEQRLPAATRKALLTRFGMLAAARLHGLEDPDIAAVLAGE
ncbi:MmcB family DNA repair protein [Alsobacter sp. R-9]